MRRAEYNPKRSDGHRPGSGNAPGSTSIYCFLSMTDAFIPIKDQKPVTKVTGSWRSVGGYGSLACKRAAGNSPTGVRVNNGRISLQLPCQRREWQQIIFRKLSENEDLRILLGARIELFQETIV